MYTILKNILIFHQLTGDDVDKIIQDLERRHRWTAGLLNAGISAGHLFTITTTRGRGLTVATRRAVPPFIEL